MSSSEFEIGRWAVPQPANMKATQRMAATSTLRETVKTLALTFGVSREAIVRRLLTFGRTTDAFYRRKRAQYAKEYQQQQQRNREKNEGKPIPRNMPRETVATFGRPFVRRVIENYHLDRISLSDVSGYLGVKVRHVAGIEQQLGFS